MRLRYGDGYENRYFNCTKKKQNVTKLVLVEGIEQKSRKCIWMCKFPQNSSCKDRNVIL